MPVSGKMHADSYANRARGAPLHVFSLAECESLLLFHIASKAQANLAILIKSQ